MDYFSKWAKAIVFRDFTMMTVAKFIWIHIFYRFGAPETITTISGQPFKSATLYKLYASNE